MPRRLLALLAGGLGLAWVARRRRLGSMAAATPAPAPAGDPAERLRRTLAESRSAEGPQAESEGQQAGSEDAATEAEPLDVRRRAVHERAQAAIREMEEG